MDSILIFVESNNDLGILKEFANKNNFKFVLIDDDTKQMIAREELSKLGQKNPRAYATDEEIISVVEEVRKSIQCYS